MINNTRRQEIEHEIVTKIVEYALSRGLDISVWNGGDVPEVKRTSDKDKILKAMFQCDYESITFYKHEPQSVGCIDFVYGNDGYDVVADYTSNALTEEIFAVVQPLVHEYEREAIA